jgi:hypothetical protein
MATITITKTTYAAWDGDPHNAETDPIDEETTVYTVEDFCDDFGDWQDDECTVWVPARVTDAAVNLLTGMGGTNFWANEGDGSYFVDEPYIHPYTGEREEQFASLRGFTDDGMAYIRNYAIAR